jgi:hypothetical protein
MDVYEPKKLNFHVRCNGEPLPETIKLFNRQIDKYFKEYILEKLNTEKTESAG